MSICVSVHWLTQSIRNSQRIRDDLARVDWSTPGQARSVQVLKNRGLVRSESQIFHDWTWTTLDDSSSDWPIAELVEALVMLLAA